MHKSQEGEVRARVSKRVNKVAPETIFYPNPKTEETSSVEMVTKNDLSTTSMNPVDTTGYLMQESLEDATDALENNKPASLFNKGLLKNMTRSL